MEDHKFNVDDLVEYRNPRSGVFRCWVTAVHDGGARLDLRSIDHGYNIMSVPAEYVEIAGTKTEEE